MIHAYAELLRYYRRLVIGIFVGIVGGVALISAFFLFTMPVYTATAKVSLLPTESELDFSTLFSRGTSFNPANLMSETHIEYLLSRETARRTIDRLIEEYGSPEPVQRSGFKAALAKGFRTVKNTIRMAYNILNSGQHVPVDAYTDAVLTLQDSIDAEMVEGTYIMEISVTWDSPQIATSMANMLADVYITRAREQAADAALGLERELSLQLARNPGMTAQLSNQIDALRLARETGFDVLRVIDPAVAPIYPSFPKVVVNVLIAIAAATLISIFALVSADTFSGTIKTRADLDRILGRLSLPTTQLRNRRTMAETARILRLHADVDAAPGAVVSLEDDRDADDAADYIRNALRGQPTPAQHTKYARARTESPDSLVPAEDDPPGPVSLGGAAGRFSLSAQPVPQWLVLTLRPGRIDEAELAQVVADWKQRGTTSVLAMLLRA